MPLSAAIAQAVAALAGGGVVLLPTDTVYGLAASCSRGSAGLRALKGGRGDKAFVVMLADHAQLAALHVAVNRPARALLQSPWMPGPLTLVLPRPDPDLPPAWLNGRQQVAVRIPADKVTLAVLRHSGMLFVTSANPSAIATPACVSAIMDSFTHPQLIDAVIDDGPRARPASTIVRCLDHGWVIERHGAVSDRQLHSYLQAFAESPAG